jgi:Holliday junction DNA helicase RuvA
VQAAADAAKPAAPEDQMRSDLLSALLNLGYQRPAAEKAIDKALTQAVEPRFEDALRAVLRALMK